MNESIVTENVIVAEIEGGMTGLGVPGDIIEIGVEAHAGDTVMTGMIIADGMMKEIGIKADIGLNPKTVERVDQ